MDSNNIPHFFSGERLKASDLNIIGDAARRALPADSSNTVNGSLGVKKRRLWGGQRGGLNLAYVDFGYEITDNVLRMVNFNEGIFRCAQSHLTCVAQEDVVISTSPAYIYLEYIRGGTPSLMPPTNDLNTTISDADSYRHLFYTFTIDTSGLLEPQIHHLGSVQVGAYWG